MFEINANNIVTILTIVFCSGGTIMYLRTALDGLLSSFSEFKKDTKDEIKILTQKIEQHNNFGLQLTEIKTRLNSLEKRLESMEHTSARH